MITRMKGIPEIGNMTAAGSIVPYLNNAGPRLV